MNVLILCKKFPYPLKEGEPIAISYLARSLHSLGCRISLLVLNTSKHFFDIEKLPTSENFYHHIYSVEINNDITVPGALNSLIKGESYILTRFNSDIFREKLKAVLVSEHFDVIQLETIYMAHYIDTIRATSKALIVLRTHNVEHLIWNRVASTTNSFFKKIYLKMQNRSLKKFEINQVEKCDLLVTITDKDRELFTRLGTKVASVVAPVGINLDEYVFDGTSVNQGQSIGFIGALDWMPNQDGINWFLNKIWPAIEREFPEATLYIAGKNTPDWMFQKATNRVIVAGEVADAKEFIRLHPVLVAPLFSGSGIKVKVLEGMALGRVVLTTSIGAEGIPATNKKEILIADDENQFLEMIRFAFREPDKVTEIGRQARDFIQLNFAQNKIGKTVFEEYKKACQLTDQKSLLQENN